MLGDHPLARLVPTRPAVFDHDEVEHLLPMRECIEVVEQALKALDHGEYAMPLRSIYSPPGAAGAMAWMPAHRSGKQAVFGMKLLVVVPGNPARGLDTHQGAVVLMDGTTGQLKAVLDASALTAIRTAAVSAVATRALAREDAEVLAIIGTGVQARKHLEAIPLVRPIRRVVIAGRTPQRAEEFVRSVRPPAPQRGREMSIEAAASVEDAVQSADVVVTCTSSPDPVVSRAMLRKGMHINAIGASRPPAHELEPAALADVVLFTDRRESLEGEAHEWRTAVDQGIVKRDHLRGELGQLLNGSVKGRQTADEVTVFRSLGLAVEDVAAAQHVLEKSRAPEPS